MTTSPVSEAITAGFVRAKPETGQWPRIAFVTPVRNSAKYIEQTIQSVLAQNYPNLDYFIVDGGSTDGTLDIIRKYEGQISGWISEPDNGMYDAINKGFAHTSGEVMGWISATDMLHPGGLAVVGGVFRDLPEVEWITGRPTLFSEEGMTTRIGSPPHWSRYRFLAGANRHIMQEATFWRRSLWEKAGGYVDSSERFVSDFELWVRFFRHARLYPVDALTGGYRAHDDALSVTQMKACQESQDKTIERELEQIPFGEFLRCFQWVSRVVKPIPKVRGFWARFVMRSLYEQPGPDCAPLIEFRRENGRCFWAFRLR